MTFAIIALLLSVGPETSPEALRFHSTPLALAPVSVTSFGAAVQGGWLYVLGGARGRPHHYDRLSQSPVFTRMNLNSPDDWEVLPETTPLQSVALIAHGDGLVRIGGMRSRNEPDTAQDNISVDEVARFDPATRRWTPLPSLPEGRSSHDAVIIGSTVYVAGGWRMAGKDGAPSWHDTVIRMDLAAASPRWETVTTAPTKRRALALAAVGQHLYLLGGMTEAGRTTTLVEVYDLQSNKWIDAPSIPRGAMLGFGMSAFGVDGVVVASAMAGHVLTHSPGDKKWKKSGKLAFPRFFHRLVPDTEGGLYCIGGSGHRGRIRHIEHLRPRRHAAPHVATFDVPYTGRAKNRQGCVLAGQTLVMSGGNDSLGDHDFSENNFVDETWELDLATMRVKSATAFPSRLQSMATVLTRGGRSPEGVAIGGFGHRDDVARTVSSVSRYDGSKGSWHTAEVSMPARSQIGLARHDDAIWMFGGLEYDPRLGPEDRFRHPLDVRRWNHAAFGDAFEDANVRLPRPRRAFAGASLGGRYYLVGGMREEFKLVETCDVFDFTSKQWSTIPSPARPRIDAQLIPLGGKLYLAGGRHPDGDGMAPATSIEVFDPATGAWSIALETIPISPRHLRAFAFNERLLLVSTHQDSPKLRVALVTF